MLHCFHPQILINFTSELVFLSKVQWNNRYTHEEVNYVQYECLPVVSPFKYSVSRDSWAQNSSGPMASRSSERLSECKVSVLHLPLSNKHFFCQHYSAFNRKTCFVFKKQEWLRNPIMCILMHVSCISWPLMT